MTDPLIDRDALARVICGNPDDPEAWKKDARTVRTTEMVMHYLREALTPEALEPRVTYNYRHFWTLNGDDLHRRIFREDK